MKRTKVQKQLPLAHHSSKLVGLNFLLEDKDGTLEMSEEWRNQWEALSLQSLVFPPVFVVHALPQILSSYLLMRSRWAVSKCVMPHCFLQRDICIYLTVAQTLGCSSPCLQKEDSCELPNFLDFTLPCSSFFQELHYARWLLARLPLGRDWKIQASSDRGGS